MEHCEHVPLISHRKCFAMIVISDPYSLLFPMLLRSLPLRRRLSMFYVVEAVLVAHFYGNINQEKA